MHGLNESRFNMWRAVVVMAHADSVVKPHEINFIVENTRNLPMTEEQRSMLAEDIRKPGAMQSVFDKITSPRDKEDFFHLARAICWSDGDFDDSEQALLDHLKSLALAVEDHKAMKSSLIHFKDVFIDGKEKVEDQSLLMFVKGLINTKAA
jgi:uncharacterized membrane protein YebE (DUF533 family)